MSKNKDYNKLIHKGRWLRLRRDILSAHPLCQRCLEKDQYSPATEVHHIVPCENAAGPKEMERLMYDPHNLLALCHRCHVEVHIEMGRGGGKAGTRRRTEAQKADFVKKFGLNVKINKN